MRGEFLEFNILYAYTILNLRLVLKSFDIFDILALDKVSKFI